MPRYLFSYPKDDNDFRPHQRLQKQQKIVKKKKQTRIYNKNGWDEDENRKYRQFLELNSQLLMNREQRRQKKVFLRLSQHVETRDANQCRSHHQKMIQKYKTIEKILEFLRYLEERDGPVEKNFPTCQHLNQMEPSFQQNHSDQIDRISQIPEDKDNDNFLHGFFKDEEIDKYLNFLDDDIWLT